MSIEIKHPEALAIAKRGNSVNWDMGDYLLKVAGKPSDSKANNGSYKTIEEVSEELTENGYPQFSVRYMALLRQVAYDFAARYRVSSVSWTTHRAAGTPEVLIAVMDAAKAKGRKGVSKRFVMDVINGMNADRIAKRKGTEIRARKAAARAEEERQQAAVDKAAAKRRQDDAATKAAQKREDEAISRAERNRGRARKLRGAPKRDKSKTVKPPKPEEVPHLIAKTKFMRDSAEAVALVRRMDREISPHIDDLSKAFIVGSVEELLEIAEMFRKLAAKLNRNQTEKRAHLHAVVA
jgi:hypothetical protein